MEDMLKVLMMGNRGDVKGGITSVIQQILKNDWRKEGIELRFIPTYTDRNPAAKAAVFAEACCRMTGMMRKDRPDLVYVHMSYRGSFVRARALQRIALRFHVPFVMHLHGSEFEDWYRSLRPEKQGQVREFLGNCRSVVVLGEHYRDSIQSICPGVPVEIVHNAVELPDRITDLNDTGNRILFLGVLIRRKGVEDLLRAFAIAKPEKWRLVLAGSGPEEESLKKLAQELGIADRTDFPGWIDGEKKRELLESSQILALPSYNEGLPIAILEAMSFGLPVISTTVGDIPACVRNGKNGILVSPGDIDALARALSDLTSHEEMWRKYSRNARDTIEADFDEKHFYRKISAMWRRSICEPGTDVQTQKQT
ncbi:MAG: glycosyltransferase family 4 protein [Bilifractor sp.]|jgi:glycosyltransferase involved in cell wall biosynthesis